MSRLSALGHIGLAFETTYGTAVAPTVFIPYDTVKAEDDIKKVVDEARRAVLTKDFGVYNTTRQGKVEIDANVYPEILGYFLKGILGGYAVTGTGPYTHTFTVANTLPPSFTISDYNSMTERQYAGAVISELGLKFDTENLMKLNAKFESKASVTTTTNTPTFSVTDPFRGFQATLKIGGSSNLNMVGGEVTIKRDVALLFTANNTQDPSKFSAGRIELTGKLTFDVEDETELNYYLQGTQPSLQFTFTRDANTSLDITCSKVDFTKATVDRGQEYVRVDAEFRALYNTTDNGMTKIQLKNSITTYN